MIKNVEKAVRNNSTTILTAIGVSGTISTAYLAGRASFEAANKIMMFEIEGGVQPDSKERIKERLGLVWKLYIPATASGVITITCIVGATRIGNRKAAALTAAYSLSEKAFVEYREKVIEKLGERKEQTVRDEIAQAKVDRSEPPCTRDVVLVGPGNVLCFEGYTGRYFMSDMESLRKAQNDINAKLMRDDTASLSDFFYIIGLPYTSFSSHVGWNSNKLMELRFSTVMSEDQRPCISFEYNYINPF